MRVDEWKEGGGGEANGRERHNATDTTWVKYNTVTLGNT